ncbi:MAG: ROK family protein [Alphaproteobacteria bacterium]
MSTAIGLDIGGTKIAGAAYDSTGKELAQIALPTPPTYETFLETCRVIVAQLEQKTGRAASMGACAPSADASVFANMPALTGKPLRQDLEQLFARKIPFANDANCAALAEAMEGAGSECASVFGLILGTGVGGGFVLNGEIVAGVNGLCGEIGHLPLPYYEPEDGERTPCGCGQSGCIEKLIAGAALSRLYESMTTRTADAKQIGEQARAGDRDALRVLDRYYTVVAKAMVTILHSFDPEIITVSGGLNALPGLYVEVPKRWAQFALAKNAATQFAPAEFGSMSGLRGAAWLGKNS